MDMVGGMAEVSIYIHIVFRERDAWFEPYEASSVTIRPARLHNSTSPPIRALSVLIRPYQTEVLPEPPSAYTYMKSSFPNRAK